MDGGLNIDKKNYASKRFAYCCAMLPYFVFGHKRRKVRKYVKVQQLI